MNLGDIPAPIPSVAGSLPTGKVGVHDYLAGAINCLTTNPANWGWGTGTCVVVWGGVLFGGWLLFRGGRR